MRILKVAAHAVVDDPRYGADLVAAWLVRLLPGDPDAHVSHVSVQRLVPRTLDLAAFVDDGVERPERALRRAVTRVLVEHRSHHEWRVDAPRA